VDDASAVQKVCSTQAVVDENLDMIDFHSLILDDFPYIRGPEFEDDKDAIAHLNGFSYFFCKHDINQIARELIILHIRELPEDRNFPDKLSENSPRLKISLDKLNGHLFTRLPVFA
jgi:hypothetical protein